MLFWKKWKLSPLWEIFVGERYRNVYFFCLTLIPNFFAALLEGFSFGFLLLALSTFTGEKRIQDILPFLNHFPFFISLSTKQIFLFLVLGAVVSQIIRSIVVYLSQYLMIHLSLRIQVEAQKKVYRQIFRLSFPCVSLYKVGDLSKYVEAPVYCIGQVCVAANNSVVHLMTMVINLGVMMALNVSLTIVCIIFFSVSIFFQKYLFKKIAEISLKFSNWVVDFSKRTVQNLHGMRQIHVFARQKSVLQKMENTNIEVAKASLKLSLWNNLVPSLNEVLSVFALGMVLILGCIFLDSKNFLPVLLTYLTISYRLAIRIREFLGTLGSTISVFGYLVRTEEILQDSDKEFCSTSGEKLVEFAQHIEFRNVSLSYLKNHVFAVKNFSCFVPKNAVIALVGSSGAGKSSIMDLLVRLYEPTSGMILVDGQDIRKFELSSWREKLGVVSQDSFIFNETIEENIRFGKLEASHDEIIQAAKMAHAHDFIMRLPEGYQSIVEIGRAHV